MNNKDDELKSIGFSDHEITLINNICEDESISTVALLRQALRKWQGVADIKFPPSSID